MNLEGELTLLQTACAHFPVDERLIELTGADRKEWLQGQVTQDLRKLTPPAPLGFCLCEPTGQLLAFGSVWEDVDRLLLSMPTACVPAVLRRVETMVIMEDVEARLLELGLTSLQGPRANPELSTLSLPHDRLGLGGVDIWSSAPLPPIATLSPEAAQVARLEAGVPLFGVDTTAKTLPPELGPAFEARHVSYTKGCYTGQEVLMRIHSRGHTNRTWMGLILDRPVSPGAAISFGGEECGAVTSTAVSPRLGPIATAMLRNLATAAGAEVQVGPATGRVIPLPF